MIRWPELTWPNLQMLVFRTDDGRDSKGRRKDESTLETCTMGDMQDE
jgi:hypothetical protein